MSFLERIRQAFEDEDVNFALVGGFAVALHGAPRGTIDIDCIIRHTEEDFVRCDKALRKAGLEPRLPVTAKEVFQFRKEYIEQRNMIAWSFINPQNPFEILDVILTKDLRKMATVSKKFGLYSLKIVSLNDLIKMKTGTGRQQDQEDVKTLELLHGQNKK